MNEVALRRRIVALVIAALLATSGAALTTGYFAAYDPAATNIRGTFGPDDHAIGNTGSANDLALRGGGDNDT